MSSSIRVERVTAQTAAEFVAYVVAHGPEHDDSFADVDELRDFDSTQEIAFIARDGGAGSGPVVGAASLMVRGYCDEGLGRLRILHALVPEDYGLILDAVLAERPIEIERVVSFFFEDAPAIEVLLRLGFAPKRYAIVLMRSDMDVAVPSLPEGVILAPARPEADEQAWADIINGSFAGYPDRYDVTADQAAERLADERLLPEGALIAWREGTPIGLVAVAQYDEDGDKVVWVDHLAVVPEAQGRGVGRALLRAAVGSALRAGFSKIDLATGQTNEKALCLYASEGFQLIRRVVCLGRDLER